MIITDCHNLTCKTKVKTTMQDILKKIPVYCKPCRKKLNGTNKVSIASMPPVKKQQKGVLAGV